MTSFLSSAAGEAARDWVGPLDLGARFLTILFVGSPRGRPLDAKWVWLYALWVFGVCMYT